MKNDGPDDEDRELFRKAIRDVTPLKPDNKARHKIGRRKTRPVDKSIAVTTPAVADVFSDEYVDECPEHLNFSRSGIQPATLKKLRMGKLPVDDTIDLHGLTIDEARQYLMEFLGECENNSYRHVIIIHGKGMSSMNKKPVLKPLINRWLKQLDQVLAFNSAKPVDGGTGAVYVLLKRSS